MHRQFRKLLPQATGQSRFVVAVNLDIREFTSFMQKRESPEAAVFLKGVYMRLIDDYFREADYYKPTGDGLLVIVPYSDGDLEEVATTVVGNCLKAVKDFPELCATDSMVNFETPRHIGIGVARGTARRLCCRGSILDYSGRVLNLASRLMDLARPTGVVLDAEFDLRILPTSLRRLFEHDSVFVKGIAENKPIGIYYTKRHTHIPSSAREPLGDIDWKTEKLTLTLNRIRELAPTFSHPLERRASIPKDIKVEISYPAVKRGKRVSGVSTVGEVHGVRPERGPSGDSVLIGFDKLAQHLEEVGVKRSWQVILSISYPVRETASGG